MIPALHIDFETRSCLDLGAVGTDVYAKHESTGVWCMSYAFDGEPVKTIYPEQESLPAEVHRHVVNGGLVVGHNVAFELAIWNNCPNIMDPWPELRAEQCRCTMAMAYAMSLPGSLENAAAALGLSVRKDQEGRRVMLQMCRPRSLDPLVWWDDAAKLRRLVEYCEQDVAVEAELWNRMARLPAREQRVWELDYRINRRGVHVDLPSVNHAIALVQHAKAGLDQRMNQTTGGAVGACTQVLDIVEWLNSQGVAVTSIAKSEVAELLSRGDLPDHVREALETRQEAGKSSTAKLTKMRDGVDEDCRLRGMFQYHGASTGRWSGRRVQLQNLPRPKHSKKVVATAFNFLDQPEWFDLMGIGPMDLVPSMLRGMLTAAPGHDLVAVDFNAIEARVLAWLADQDDVLDVFRAGGDIYCHQASAIYGRPIDKDRDPEERQIGKVAILALGYQGGVGAFQAMAKAYGVKVSDERADQIKTAWRDVNGYIRQYWYTLEGAAMSAVQHPGSTHAVGHGVAFRVNGSFLWCRLPSGRNLCYPYPKIAPKEMWWGDVKDCISFKAVDSVTGRWSDQWTYGGSLAENVTQAVARDCLVEAMFRVEEDLGYPIVMHVHDEIVAEVRESDERAYDAIRDVCSRSPTWAPDLPITAEGWRGKRYRK